METETDPTEAERVEAAQQHLQAALIAAPPSVPIAPPSSNLSEMGSLHSLMQTLVQRVDQVAKTSAEQFGRVESTLSAMEATMKLAREMIVAQDKQYTEMTDLVDRLETISVAQAKIQANLSEIVAALLAPPQKG